MELRKDAKIFVKLGFTDMRKQINGLAAIAQAERAESPFDGSYYVFCGKTRQLVKILYWDKTGFCLWAKRLERDRFPWPKNASELTEMARQRVRLLLKGINVWSEHEEARYELAG
jgi:transposase